MSEVEGNPIGGYFELELPARQGHFHAKALRLNSGRSCLGHIIQQQHVQKVYLPYFSCRSLLEPLEFHKVEYEFYRLDSQFEIIDGPILRQDERLLFINYYGLKTDYLSSLMDRHGSSVIADNTHSFFSQADARCPAFCSPRKFFGVPDGGYLDGEFAGDGSAPEWKANPIDCSHLIGRIEYGPQASFDAYHSNERRFAYDGVRAMSRLSERILSSIDYARVKIAREANFQILHQALAVHNKLGIDASSVSGPLCYPLWTESDHLRQRLIENLIFVPTYWDEVLDRLPGPDLVERDFVRAVLPLPVDQRYSEVDMKRIIEVVKREL